MEVNWRSLLLLIVVIPTFTIGLSDSTCDNDNCYATNGYVCNDQGSCDCGTCVCNSPYTGITCEECPTCPTPCELFKGCVGCKIFGTGLVGVMECITQCEYMANYIPVDKDQFDLESADSELVLCKHTNEDYCVESFKIGGMTGGYRDLYVRTEMDCRPVDVATLPPQVEVPVVTSKLEPTTHKSVSDTTTSTTEQYISTEDSRTSTVETTKQTDRETGSVESSTKTTTSTLSSYTQDNSDNTVILVDIEDPDQSAEDSAPQNVDPVSGSDNPSSGCRLGSDSSVAFLFVCVASCLRYILML